MRSGLRVLLLTLIVTWALLLRGWFAAANPTHSRFYDERFSVRNASQILNSGSFAPENGFYPSLSYLPALPFLAATEWYSKQSGNEHLRVLNSGMGTKIGRQGLADGFDFSPTGYRIARWVGCVLAALSIVVTYRIARHVYGFRVAVLGAFLLAATPWHLRQSAVFKPDIVLVATVALAVWFSMMAIERRGWSDFALAGVAIGLALSAKFNAVPVVVPLVVAVLMKGREDRSLFAKLAVSAVVSAGVFLLLNPYVISRFWLFKHDFSATVRAYGRKADAADMSFGRMVLDSFFWLCNSLYHGRALGVLAVLGLIVQGRDSLQRDKREPFGIHSAMLLSFTIGYICIFSFGSQNPEGFHNWLVLIPFTSISAALVIVRFSEWLSERVPSPVAARTLSTALVVFVIAAPTMAVHRFAYHDVVPTTQEKLREVLRTRWNDIEQRLVYQEKGVPPLPAGRQRYRRPVTVRIDQLSDLPERRLDLADAEVFPASRLVAPGSEFYNRRMERHMSGVVEVSSRWLDSRGEDLVLVEHGWEREGKPVDVVLQLDAGGDVLAGRLPSPGRSRSVASLELWLADDSATEGVLAVGDAPVELVPARRRDDTRLFLSRRFRIPAKRELPVTVKAAPLNAGEMPSFVIRLHWWRPRTPAR